MHTNAHIHTHKNTHTFKYYHTYTHTHTLPAESWWDGKGIQREKGKDVLFVVISTVSAGLFERRVCQEISRFTKDYILANIYILIRKCSKVNPDIEYQKESKVLR